MTAQFTVSAAAGFYLAVAEEVTVYADYEAAVADLEATLAAEADGFLARVTVDQDGADDVAVTLEQVDWQRIVRDLVEMDAAADASAGEERG